MNWTEMLNGEIEHTYKAADSLLGLVDDDKLDWKPATGSNWMTTGQLMMHLSSACGGPCKGFATGDWGRPANADAGKPNPESMLPPAEKMPAVSSVAEARNLLQQDKKMVLDLVAKAGEHDLANKPVPAPWDPRPLPLGYRMYSMVGHLNQHKGQLFYYLKLQGKPVHTGNLWGM